MSARYIPLAVSTTPSRCRQPPHNVGNARPCRQPPHSVDNARPRPCPENAPVRPRTAARRDYAPRVPGGFPREAESTTGCLGCPRARGMPYFLLQWEERNERRPLASGDCLCPPRVRGTPARARAGRASALSRPDARGNARTRQGWPPMMSPRPSIHAERPHAPGLAGPGGRRGRPGGGTPARARAGPSPASPRLSATPGGTRTRTLIYRTRTAHKGWITPLCAAPCSLIPFLVCDTKKERGQDPRGTRRTGHSCCTA